MARTHNCHRIVSGLAAAAVTLTAGAQSSWNVQDENSAGLVGSGEAGLKTLFDSATVVLPSGGAGAGDVNVPGIFPEFPPPVRPDLLRRSIGRINPGALSTLGEPGGNTLVTNLFEDVAYSLVFTRSIPNATYGTTTWFGRTSGSDLDNVVLVMSDADGMTALNVYDPEGLHYQVRRIIDDVYAVEELDPTIAPPEDEGELDPGPPAETNRDFCEDGSRIDLMVVYTPAVRDYLAYTRGIIAAYMVQEEWGPCPPAAESPWDLNRDGEIGVLDWLLVLTMFSSDHSTHAAIDVAVAEANLAYGNSEIPVTLELVHRTEIHYVEDEEMWCTQAVTRLMEPDDGYMDEVHALRDEHLADVVALLTTACTGGSAFVMRDPSPSFEERAFSAMRTPDRSFVLAHEVGHNMGCCHAYGDPGCACLHGGAYPYSRGHRLPADAPQWRTIMAYGPGALIPCFSNPYVYHDGYPTGIPAGEPLEADNAWTIMETAVIVANFRERCP
jgi:hypothetical protein